jgi:hypothetical protein
MDNLLPLLGAVAAYLVLVKLVFPRLGIRG